MGGEGHEIALAAAARTVDQRQRRPVEDPRLEEVQRRGVALANPGASDLDAICFSQPDQSRPSRRTSNL